MKNRLTVFFMALLGTIAEVPLSAQHLSTTLPVYPSGNSIFYGGLFLDQAFYLYGDIGYKDSNHVAIMKLDLQGKLLWQRLMSAERPDYIQSTVLEGLHFYQGKLVQLSVISKQPFENWCSFRFFDTSGVFLEERTFKLPTINRFVQGCLVHNDDVFLYGIQNMGGQGAGWISKMDRWDSLPEPSYFLVKTGEEVRNFKVVINSKGDFLAGLTSAAQGKYATTLFHIDTNFVAYKIHRFTSGTRDIGFIGLLPAKDSSVVFSSFTTSTMPGQSHAATVRKIDTYGSVAWEYRFETEDIRNIADLVMDEEENITGVGYTNYVFTQTKDFTKFTNAWHFKLSKNGKLKWMRHIIQPDKDADGAFYKIIPGDTALYYVGQHANFLGFSAPLPTDKDFWVLGIGKDGCWNGDCNAVINIPAKPVRAQTVSKEWDIQAYPNPVSESFRLHGEVQGVTAVALLDIHGRMVSSWSPGKMDSVYSLPAALPSGTYWLRIWNQRHTQAIPLSVIRQP